MHITPQQIARGVVLGGEIAAVMQEPRRARAAADLVEPTQRIVAQAGARAAAAADQAVLDIVDVAVGAIRGQSLSPRRRGLPLAS